MINCTELSLIKLNELVNVTVQNIQCVSNAQLFNENNY